MNNLKQYAGLLNDAAPENHFLAYINSDEANILKQSGGSGEMTPQGILSFRPQDMGNAANQASSAASTGSSSNSSSSNSSSSNSSSSSSSSSSNSGNDNNNYTGSDYGFVASQPNTADVGFQEALKDPYNTGDVDAENEYLAPDIDHYKATQKAIDQSKKDLGDLDQSDYSDWSKEDQDTYQLEMNKLKGTEGKNYSFYAGNEGTINNTFGENWKDAVVVTPALKFSPTLRFLVAGAKTLQQNATTDYGTGYYGGTDFTGGGSGMPVDGGGWIGRIFNSDGSVNENITETEANDLYNQAKNDLPFLIGNTKPQESMVNKYFSSMGSNLGVSSAYMDTYNAAKTKIANTLNLQPNNQQFGYGNAANDNFARSMTSANPFFDELTNQGLI